MEFEWDEAKAAANLTKHGIDFLDAADALRDPRKVDLIDRRRDYGEARFRCICAGPDALFAVIYTMRGEDRYRLISARKANRHEQRQYAQDRPLQT